MMIKKKKTCAGFADHRRNQETPYGIRCACRGSINVHQDCLHIWLNLRGYKQCEDAPERLPVHEFLIRVCVNESITLRENGCSLGYGVYLEHILPFFTSFGPRSCCWVQERLWNVYQVRMFLKWPVIQRSSCVFHEDTHTRAHYRETSCWVSG